MALHLFVKKDDADGRAFYYLGEARTRDVVDTEMPGENGAFLPVVKMKLDLKNPIDDGLYRYLTSRISD